jgi:hypothetical protein
VPSLTCAQPYFLTTSPFPSNFSQSLMRISIWSSDNSQAWKCQQQVTELLDILLTAFGQFGMESSQPSFRWVCLSISQF